MQRYISLLLVLVLSVLVIVFSGCSSNPPPKLPGEKNGSGGEGKTRGSGVDVDDIPAWFLNPPSDPDNLYAATTSSAADLSMAFETAENAGRVDITSEIQTKVTAMFRRYRQEVGAGEDSELESLSEAISQEVVSEVVRGIRRELGEVKQEGSVTYRVYVLMKMPLRLAKATLVSKVKADSNMHLRFRASEAFKELEKEVEQYEQK